MADFEKIIEKIVQGVYIITSRSRNREAGCTAAWVSRASFKPPLVSVSISPDRHTHKIIAQGKVFAVNLLGRDQVELAKYFGSVSGKYKDKFKDTAFEVKKTGSPILEDALAYLDCKVVGSFKAGDHTIFVGEVVDAAVQKKGVPLVFKKEDFF